MAGAAQPPTFAGVEGSLSCGDLAPGGSVSGTVCFDPVAQGQRVVLHQRWLHDSRRGAWVQ